MLLLALILHMDLNQTIIPSDPAGKKTIEDVVAHNLAKTVEESWEPGLKKMSYFNYVYDHKFDAPRSDQVVKKQKLALLSAFPRYLEEIRHPRAREINETYTAVLSKIDGLIVPSFYHLIDHLQAQKEPFTLVLRTFGSELHQAIAEIEKNTSVRFAATGKFIDKKLHLSTGKVLATAAEIEEYFAHNSCAVQDDWKVWNSHNETGPYGKVLPIKRGRKTLFFDDHVNTDPEAKTNIVAPIDAETGAPLPLYPLIREGKVIKAHILDAILDDNYFIRRLCPT